jgi:hypothetical protein
MASLVYVHLILRSSSLKWVKRCVPGITTAFREASILNRANPLIIKGEDFEIEILTGTDVYFASKKLG